MANYVELEYKYRADNIKLEDFCNLIKRLNPLKETKVSSWDYYFCKKEDPFQEYPMTYDSSFIRFRDSTINPELTQKTKTHTNNNFNRVEIDLPLDRTKITLETVNKFMNTLGYEENFRIYKNCFVYWLDSVNFVYYTVFDKDLKELGRFIEVEVNKEKVTELDKVNKNPYFSGSEIELDLYANKLEELGLTSKNIMQESLFELFKK